MFLLIPLLLLLRALLSPLVLPTLFLELFLLSPFLLARLEFPKLSPQAHLSPRAHLLLSQALLEWL